MEEEENRSLNVLSGLRAWSQAREKSEDVNRGGGREKDEGKRRRRGPPAVLIAPLKFGTELQETERGNAEEQRVVAFHLPTLSGFSRARVPPRLSPKIRTRYG